MFCLLVWMTLNVLWYPFSYILFRMTFDARISIYVYMCMYVRRGMQYNRRKSGRRVTHLHNQLIIFVTISRGFLGEYQFCIQIKTNDLFFTSVSIEIIFFSIPVHFFLVHFIFVFRSFTLIQFYSYLMLLFIFQFFLPLNFISYDILCAVYEEIFYGTL